EAEEAGRVVQQYVGVEHEEPGRAIGLGAARAGRRRLPGRGGRLRGNCRLGLGGRAAGYRGTGRAAALAPVIEQRQRLMAPGRGVLRVALGRVSSAALGGGTRRRIHGVGREQGGTAGGGGRQGHGGRNSWIQDAPQGCA